jgi:hypothetical protein
VCKVDSVSLHSHVIDSCSLVELLLSLVVVRPSLDAGVGIDMSTIFVCQFILFCNVFDVTFLTFDYLLL